MRQHHLLRGALLLLLLSIGCDPNPSGRVPPRPATVEQATAPTPTALKMALDAVARQQPDADPADQVAAVLAAVLPPAATTVAMAPQEPLFSDRNATFQSEVLDEPAFNGINPQVLAWTRSDPQYASKMLALLQQLAGMDGPKIQVWFGQPASAHDFPDCVAVGNFDAQRGTRWTATGVLIAPNAVLTAAHSFDPAERYALSTEAACVGFGSDWSEPREIVAVRRVVFADGMDFISRRSDLAILVLDDLVTGYQPTTLLDDQVILQPRDTLVVAGFGKDEYDDAGIKRFAEVHIRSSNCDSDSDQAAHGCFRNHELVAIGPLARDTCFGDSGGPIYALRNGQYSLVGITSRAAFRSSDCGGGGVYVLVKPYLQWMHSIHEVNWPVNSRSSNDARTPEGSGSRWEKSLNKPGGPATTELEGH